MGRNGETNDCRISQYLNDGATMKELLLGIVLAVMIAVTKQTAKVEDNKVVVLCLSMLYGMAAAAIASIIINI